MMAFVKQTRLLLWKNSILQRRRRLLFLVEISCPLILASILLGLRARTPNHRVDTPTVYYENFVLKYRLHTFDSDNFEMKYDTNGTVGYAPEVKDVEEVMKYFREDFNFRAFYFDLSVTFKGFKSVQALEDYARKHSSEMSMGITFLNVDKDTGEMPKNARVAIRPIYIGKWQTDLVYDHYQRNVPRDKDKFVYLSNGVLYFQKLVAQSLIKFWLHKKGGNPNSVNPTVATRRMTYPPYTDDGMVQIIKYWLGATLAVSVVVFVVTNTKDLAHEKENKLKESMKLMGLTPFAHWVSWFIFFAMQMLIVDILMIVSLGVPSFGDNGAILQHSNLLVVSLFIMVYGLSCVTFSFMISAMFHTANVGALVSFIIHFVSLTPMLSLLPNYWEVTKTSKLLTSSVYNMAVVYGAYIIGLYEAQGKGIQWDNIFKPTTVNDTLTLAECMSMLVIDSIVHLLVFWYLDNVHPGEFGVPKPFYFCFTKSYWLGPGITVDGSSQGMAESENQIVSFETDPSHLRAGIEMKGLTKTFGGKAVVDNLFLKMYEGQITVLLGHNGAGKTTTISMLTGFIPPSSGTATVNDCDIRKDIEGVRRNMGLCPQHDVLFDCLTVQEHLQFFGKLKGAPDLQTEEFIGMLLREFGLLDKIRTQAKTLSRGQKRKLSVAISLIARPNVVILDEPTSGMDPTARRQTWDVLCKYREGNTIILTTHDMEEADLIGDRIAIMAEGDIKCCGSSTFLNKLYGTGYRLVVVKDSSCVVGRLTQLILSFLGAAKLESVMSEEVVYLVPDEQKYKFPALFLELEDHQEALGVRSFRMTETRMEEVFLKVGETDIQPHNLVDDSESFDSNFEWTLPTTVEPLPKGRILQKSTDVDGKDFPILKRKTQLVDMTDEELMKFTRTYTKRTGFALEMEQMLAIFVKKALYTRRLWLISTIQILLPVVIACLVMVFNVLVTPFVEDPPLELNLAKFDNPIIPTTAGLSPPSAYKRFEKLYGQQFSEGQEVNSFETSKDETYTDYLIGESKRLGLENYNTRVVVGLEMSHSIYSNLTAMSYYNAHPLHAEPIAMNYLLNTLVQFYLDSSYSLEGLIHVLPVGSKLIGEVRKFQALFEGVGKSLFISMGLTFPTAFFLYAYIKERKVGVKHLQVVSGVTPLGYWLPTFLWDIMFYSISCLCLIFVLVAFKENTVFGGTRSMPICLLMAMHGWCVLPFMYAMQFVFSNPATGTSLVLVVNLVVGLSCIIIVAIVGSYSQMAREVVEIFLMIVSPVFSLVDGFLDMSIHHVIYEMCQDSHLCVHNASHPCCKGEPDYLSMELPGVGRHVLILFFGGHLYFGVLFLIEYKTFRRMFNVDKATLKNASESIFFDSDVEEERRRINGNSPEELGKTDSILLVNLYKSYKRLVAVDHLNVGIQQKECFGLLGPNGAGKTTTFKMLTGDILATGGNAYLDGNDICNNIRKVHANMGYCPQYNALMGNLTGRETLTLYARLRGVPRSNLKLVVNTMIDIMVLDRQADKLIHQYSGGNKRKLCTAISLMGLPDFILLDEPSAGMDIKTRRHLWNVLKQVRASGRTLILTSHSMEECEALCTRLAIMVNGRFTCLGSPQNLKNKFGQGHTVIVQMGLTETGTWEPFPPAFEHLSERMPCIMKFDEHEGYVRLQVPDATIKLTDVFALMEDTKLYFNIQDYSVRQTTLEEVFIAFSRASRTKDKLFQS